MKIIPIALGSSLLLFGCTTPPPAIDSIQPGRDSTWNGLVLRVDRRNGTAVNGIRLVTKGNDGKEVIITADKGSLAAASDKNSEANNSVRITLHNALTQSGNTKVTQSKMELVLVK